MSRRLRAVLGVSAGVALVLLVVTILAFPALVPAQTPAPAAAKAPAELPPGYVGAETCKGCHEEQYAKFSQTRMGRLFLHQPRNTTEGLACEGCHGPGKAHADAGGGKGVGGMITFAKNDKTPVEKRNAICLSLSHEGQPRLLEGERSRVPRRGLHQLPRGHGEPLRTQQPRQGDRDGDVRHLPSPEARVDVAPLAHAGR